MINLNIVETMAKGDVANRGNRVAKGDKSIVIRSAFQKIIFLA
ncbi:hypothetical protein [Ulvibacterium sp.]